MPEQPLLTPYTAAEVEAAAALVAQRKAENDAALQGLAYAQAAQKETGAALAQAFGDWLKARASYLAQGAVGDVAGVDDMLYADVRAAIAAGRED